MPNQDSKNPRLQSGSINIKFAFVILWAVIAGLVLMNVYEASVVTQQRDLIRAMSRDPYCMGAK
jgi:hypothetical protein